MSGCLRRPLGELLSLAGEEPGSADDAITAAVLLDGDRLADAAYDMACEYAQQLPTASETAAWLPSWTRMRAEQVENEAFSALVESGDKDAYTRARRLIVEYPAGERQELSAQIAAARARCPVKYSALSARPAVHGPGRQLVVALPGLPVADDRHGRGRALPVPAPPGRLPGGPGTGRRRRRGCCAPATAPRAAAAGTVPPEAPSASTPAYGAISSSPAPRNSGSPPTWRKLGAGVRMWPEMDSYDLHVRAGTLERRLDVKEYRSARRLIEDLRSRVPRAAVLLPKSHEHQADLITAALPSVTVITETALRRQVRQAAVRRNQ